MKKINLLVVCFILTIVFLSGFNWNFSSESMVFYGFANNKELNINLENSAQVKTIFITPGQIVKKGEVLLEVTRSSIAVSQSDISHDISKLQSQYQIWESGLKNSLRTINAQKTERKNELQSAINKLASEMNINETLIREIESINQVKDHNGNNPRQIELDGLKSDLQLSMNTYNTEIRRIEKELYNSDNPIKIQIEKLSHNLDFVNEEEKNLNITAPNDGVVGSILCKVGENIPAFSPYLILYEQSPNHVKGYVLESLIPNINTNDTLIVRSVSHTDISIHGIVKGMGSRIIEIPPRLRKNPAFAIYGREIEISIPSNNPFLQNEKVILKASVKNKITPLFELAQIND
jgi:multidrug resistance efflux pump